MKIPAVYFKVARPATYNNLIFFIILDDCSARDFSQILSSK